MKLINQSEVRRLALDVSKKERAGKFTRVSSTFLQDAEAALRAWIVDRVKREGGGKTL